MSVVYRRLSSQELAELETEFVKFLVVNGVTADQWVTMKEESTDKVERMIDLFSDVVFEGVTRKTKYINHISAQSIYSFHFLEKEAHLIGIEDASGTLDFTQKGVIDNLKEVIPSGVKIFFQSKPYQKKRELEVFDTMQAGAVPANGDLYKHLSLLYASVVAQ